MDAFWQGSWISLCLGILFFILIHFQPYKVVPWTMTIGCVFSFCLAAIILSYLLFNSDSQATSSSRSSWASSSASWDHLVWWLCAISIGETLWWSAPACSTRLPSRMEISNNTKSLTSTLRICLVLLSLWYWSWHFSSSMLCGSTFTFEKCFQCGRLENSSSRKTNLSTQSRVFQAISWWS